MTRHFNYWKDRNVSGVKPYPLIGTSWEFFFRPASQLMLDIYKKYGKISGFVFFCHQVIQINPSYLDRGFIGARPILIVSDPELVKEMNIRDFHKFVDRNDFAFGDILNDRSLFNLKGEEWKKMRSVVRSLLNLTQKLLAFFKTHKGVYNFIYNIKFYVK